MPTPKAPDGALARLTGLEPATSGVTGRHSNQLSYNRLRPASWAVCCFS